MVSNVVFWWSCIAEPMVGRSTMDADDTKEDTVWMESHFISGLPSLAFYWFQRSNEFVFSNCTGTFLVKNLFSVTTIYFNILWDPSAPERTYSVNFICFFKEIATVAEHVCMGAWQWTMNSLHKTGHRLFVFFPFVPFFLPQLIVGCVASRHAPRWVRKWVIPSPSASPLKTVQSF